MRNSPQPKKTLHRRTFLQFVAVAGAASALHLSPWSLTDSGYQIVRRSQPMMGTILNLIVCSKDRDQAEAALEATISRMQALEQKLSRFRAGSEVAQLNTTGSLAVASDELMAVLQLAQLLNAKSDGAFDVTVLPLLDLYQKLAAPLRDPDDLLEARARLVGSSSLRLQDGRITFDKAGMGITLDGIGKGYIVDQGTTTLTNHGFQHVYVEAGGDLLVKGGKIDGQPWRIGIRSPRPELMRRLEIIKAQDLAVATSGDYFQPFSPDFSLHHILNPHTGRSSQELASCTVTAPNAALADGLATACMVLGSHNAMDLLAAFPGCNGYFVTKDLKTYHTNGFAG